MFLKARSICQDVSIPDCIAWSLSMINSFINIFLRNAPWFIAIFSCLQIYALVFHERKYVNLQNQIYHDHFGAGI